MIFPIRAYYMKDYKCFPDVLNSSKVLHEWMDLYFQVGPCWILCLGCLITKILILQMRIHAT